MVSACSRGFAWKYFCNRCQRVSSWPTDKQVESPLPSSSCTRECCKSLQLLCLSALGSIPGHLSPLCPWGNQTCSMWLCHFTSRSVYKLLCISSKASLWRKSRFCSNDYRWIFARSISVLEKLCCLPPSLQVTPVHKNSGVIFIAFY